MILRATVWITDPRDGEIRRFIRVLSVESVEQFKAQIRDDEWRVCGADTEVSFGPISPSWGTR